MNYNDFCGLNILFLSPHYDDMIYSCAATIDNLLKQGCQVTNVNIFTRSKWSIISDICDTSIISALRFQEEQKVANQLGINSISIGLADSSIHDLDAETELIMECDPFLIDKYTEKVKHIVRCLLFDIVLTPLGKYGHIDHRYTRYISDNIFNTSNVLYYEDLPYFARFRSEYSNELQLMENILFEGSFERKLLLMQQYESQFEMKNADIIQRYGNSIVIGKYVERLWK